MKKQDFLKSDAKVHIFLCSHTTFSKESSKHWGIIDISQEGAPSGAPSRPQEPPPLPSRGREKEVSLVGGGGRMLIYSLLLLLASTRPRAGRRLHCLIPLCTLPGRGSAR